MSFKFKQFTINDHRCAQKVGTDGVLLGAWTPLKISTHNILDIGTGSGLIAIMLAQRFPTAHITALDIDKESILQARENANETSWSKQISTVQADILTWQTEQRFDAIVSNPPFFDRALECPDPRRSAARHTSSLPLSGLAEKASLLLEDKGTLTVILPYDQAEQFIFICQTNGLFLARRCNIHTVARKKFRRSMLHFVKSSPMTYTEEALTLLTDESRRTDEHLQLTKDFYLT